MLASIDSLVVVMEKSFPPKRAQASALRTIDCTVWRVRYGIAGRLRYSINDVPRSKAFSICWRNVWHNLQPRTKCSPLPNLQSKLFASFKNSNNYSYTCCCLCCLYLTSADTFQEEQAVCWMSKWAIMQCTGSIIGEWL